ncbi:hypothetical protein [Azonexus sp.]|uniref:beta strand repeat-containing protein n=1 Tax=Azonexus sp. TaxID=1872668 RepID=UPI0027B9A5E9|nr:hypothetical protein [Azonexus sp.]
MTTESHSQILQEMFILATGTAAPKEGMNSLKTLLGADGNRAQLDQLIDSVVNTAANQIGVGGVIRTIAKNGLGLTFTDEQGVQIAQTLQANGYTSWSKLFNGLVDLQEGVGNTLTNRATAANSFLESLETAGKASYFTGSVVNDSVSALLQNIGESTVSLNNGKDGFDALLSKLGANGVTGSAIDGYVSGATVFADANGNGVQDSGEWSSTTDANGNYVLPQNGANGTIIAHGGVDIMTGKPFLGVLSAPAGSTVVSPLTTMLQTLLATNQASSIDQATTMLQNALGLPATVNVLTYDPLTVLANSSATIVAKEMALAVQAKALQLANVMTQVSSAIDAASSTVDQQKAALAVNKALAEAIKQTAPNSQIDLTSNTLLTGIIKAAAGTTGTTSIDQLANQLAQITGANNAAAGTATNIVDLAKVAVIAQGSATQAIISGATSGNLTNAASSYSGSALTDAIAQAVPGNLTQLISLVPQHSFTVSNNAGVVTFGGTATGDITFTINGSIATFSREGVTATTTVDFYSNFSKFSLGAGQVLAGTALQLSGKTVDGTGQVRMTAMTDAVNSATGVADTFVFGATDTGARLTNFNGTADKLDLKALGNGNGNGVDLPYNRSPLHTGDYVWFGNPIADSTSEEVVRSSLATRGQWGTGWPNSFFGGPSYTDDSHTGGVYVFFYDTNGKASIWLWTANNAGNGLTGDTLQRVVTVDSTSLPVLLKSAPILQVAVKAGDDPYIAGTEVTTATALTVNLLSSSTVNTVVVSGTKLADNTPLEVTTILRNGKYEFDATLFKDGLLTVIVTDTSGQTHSSHLELDRTVPQAVDTTAPDAVDLSATAGVQATASTAMMFSDAYTGKSIASAIQAPAATDIASIKLVIAGAGLDVAVDKLYLDANQALNANFTGSNKTINSISGINYTYDAASKTLLLTKNDGLAFAAADIDNIISGILYKPQHSNVQGDRTITISYTDLTGNIGASATATVTYDTTAPSISAFSVNSATTVSVTSNEAGVAGLYNGAALVGATVTLTANTPANITIAAQGSAITTSLVVTDVAGNTTTHAIPVLLGTNADDGALSGSGGNDFIFGFGGADVLTGDSGVDDMTGGLGDDKFVFATTDIDTAAGAVTDIIRDFGTGTDTIGGSFGAAVGIIQEAGATAASLAALLSAADTALNGTIKYYVGQVTGGDIYLVTDSNGNGYTEVIQLVGQSLASFDGAVSIVA